MNQEINGERYHDKHLTFILVILGSQNIRIRCLKLKKVFNLFNIQVLLYIIGRRSFETKI